MKKPCSVFEKSFGTGQEGFVVSRDPVVKGTGLTGPPSGGICALQPKGGPTNAIFKTRSKCGTNERANERYNVEMLGRLASPRFEVQRSLFKIPNET